ncbi:MAG: response regulator [Alphaproteobacteria bacterium]|nr:response regulator [Alphaproteobacteria bacterium]
MSTNPPASILIAEDNEVSRNMMSGILRAQDYEVHGAIDGESAIRVIKSTHIDLALVDINMAPKGGFEFVRYLVAEGRKLPVIIITGDDSTDMLMEATALGVQRVLQKPVTPERLLESVNRILKRQGQNAPSIAVESHETSFTPAQLMEKVLDLAAENVRTKKGGPYGALVADAQGQIVALGAGGKSGRVDPAAHAEIAAICKAAEKLGTADLSGYILYSSSQPTKVGQAVIASVGITKVFYGLSHEDIGALQEIRKSAEPVYEQIEQKQALAMFLAARTPD